MEVVDAGGDPATEGARSGNGRELRLSQTLQPVRGMNDILPADIGRWQYLEGVPQIGPEVYQPWIYYLGEGRYGGIISNTAGGYSFDRDPKNRRVTRYRYNAIPVDQPGRGHQTYGDHAAQERGLLLRRREHVGQTRQQLHAERQCPVRRRA